MALKTTPLHSEHLALKAKMGEFAGWDMPLYYGSQIEEHKRVREDAGMFDVSHMNVVDINGPGARDHLRYLIANDVAKLKEVGQALYGCMLTEDGGVLDDLITYRFTEQDYRIVVNAGTHDKDIAWLHKYSTDFDVELVERSELAMIAVQGPNAISKTQQVFDEEKRRATAKLKFFQGVAVGQWWIARTGYTGEDGYEIILPAEDAVTFWQELVQKGVTPCGLVARDSLRLEAGLNLYGCDMDETTSPLTSHLAWTIAWEPEDRNFIGRRAITEQKQQGVKEKLVGLVLEGRGVLRSHQRVILENGEEGITTSGGFSPILGVAIALARVPKNIGGHCKVEIRDKLHSVRVVKPSFVKNGKPIV